MLVSGDYAEDPLPLGKGHPESQADTDSFQKPVKFVIPDPNYYGTDPESKITKNVLRSHYHYIVVAIESSAVNEPSRSSTVPREGPY